MNYAFLVGLGVPNAALDSRDVKGEAFSASLLRLPVRHPPMPLVGHGTDGDEGKAAGLLCHFARRLCCLNFRPTEQKRNFVLSATCTGALRWVSLHPSLFRSPSTVGALSFTVTLIGILHRFRRDPSR